MARQALYNGIILPAQTVATALSQSIDLRPKISGDRFSLQVNYTNATTAGKTFTVASQVTETLTMTAHGQVTGSRGQCTNSGGALPTGISAATDYYIIVVDANTVKLATSLANANAGTAIDITGNGTGTQTFTPTTSAGNVLKARMSNDNVSFTDILTLQGSTAAATVTISASGSITWDFGETAYAYINLLYTPSAGTTTFSVIMNSFGSR